MICVQSVLMIMKKETSCEFYLVHMVNIIHLFSQLVTFQKCDIVLQGIRISIKQRYPFSSKLKKKKASFLLHCRTWLLTLLSAFFPLFFSLPLQVCGPLAHTDQEDVSCVQTARHSEQHGAL